MSRPHFKCFFNILPTFSILSAAIFISPLSHRNRGTLEFDIAMSKFPKMFDEDSISQIRGSCDDCDGGGGGRVDENCGQKNQTDVFNFFGAIFVTQFPPSTVLRG